MARMPYPPIGLRLRGYGKDAIPSYWLWLRGYCKDSIPSYYYS